MSNWLSIETILLELPGYRLSYLEAFATLTGLLSVWLATRPHIGTWPTGLVSVAAFFLLFRQVGLYSDMLLQVFFFAISLYGWIQWRGNHRQSLPIAVLTGMQRIKLLAVGILATGLLGWLMAHAHTALPHYFPQAAAFPYPDAFTTIASIIATMLMARKKWECWWIWIAVDIACVAIYWLKDIRFVAVEYVIFLGMAIWGLYTWKKQWQSETARTGIG